MSNKNLLEVTFHKQRGCYDLRVNSPGFGTAVLDAYYPKRSPTSYDMFLKYWLALGTQISLAKVMGAV